MKKLTARQKTWLDSQVPAAKMDTENQLSKLVEDLYKLGGAVVTYTSNGTPDTNDVVSHNLGRIPEGYIVIQKSKAGDIYNGGAAGAFLATSSAITLKCAVASNTVTLIVF